LSSAISLKGKMMAGTPGNPNHDPRSGRFTSASGLNRSNSTITQRGKAKVKENISAAGAFAVAAGAAVVGAAGAALLQGIKRQMAEHAQKHEKTFADDQWEALEMIVHKIGRIVNGNPDVVDHWVDIAGYAKLVSDRLQGVER